MNFRTRSAFLTLLLVLAGPSVAEVMADDKPSASGDQTAEKPAKESAPAEQPKERSLLEKLGDGLLEKVDDTPGANPQPSDDKADKMDRAIKGMRTAGSKLDEGLTTEDTQKIQKQVIKDLDDIINQLENPPPSQGGGGGGGGGGGSGGAGGKGGGSASGRNRRGGGGSSQRLRRPQGAGGREMSAGQQQKNSAETEEKSGGQASEKATDSSKQAQAERKAAEEEAARRKKLEMDIWGHLPPHLREELLSTYSGRVLPKYEQMVKQFYESLSTQGESKKK